MELAVCIRQGVHPDTPCSNLAEQALMTAYKTSGDAPS